MDSWLAQALRHVDRLSLITHLCLWGITVGLWERDQGHHPLPDSIDFLQVPAPLLNLRQRSPSDQHALLSKPVAVMVDRGMSRVATSSTAVSNSMLHSTLEICNL